MKKVLLFCVSFLGLLILYPNIAYGEYDIENANTQENQKKQGLLVGTVERINNTVEETLQSVDGVVQETTKSVEKTVKEVDEFTEKTVSNLSNPSESKPIKSTVDNTGDLLKGTVENTVPVVEKSTETVTETVRKTTEVATSTVDEVMDTVVDELPTIPVVTPVVDEVRKIEKKTTSTVQNVVEETEKIINETVTSTTGTTKNTVGKTVNSIDQVVAKPTEIGQENTSSPDPSVPLDSIKDADRNKGQIEKHEEVVGADEVSKSDSTSKDEMIESEEENYNPLGEIFKVHYLAVQEQGPFEWKNNVITSPSHSEDSGFSKGNQSSPILPLKTGQDWRDHTRAIVSSPSFSAAGPTLFLGGQSDLYVGTVVDVFLLLSSDGIVWVQSEAYKKSQWSHAPPGKPPQYTPFLNVEKTF